MTEKDIAALGKIVWLGISAAMPDLTFETFESLPLSFGELIAAQRTIMEQAGFNMAAKSDAGAGAHPRARSPGTT